MILINGALLWIVRVLLVSVSVSFVQHVVLHHHYHSRLLIEPDDVSSIRWLPCQFSSCELDSGSISKRMKSMLQFQLCMLLLSPWLWQISLWSGQHPAVTWIIMKLFFGQVKQENMRWFLMVDTVLLDVKYNLLLAVQTKLASDKRLEYVVDLYQM